MRSEKSIKKQLEERSLPKEFLKWITGKHLFEFFGISPETLKNWRRLRKITYSRYAGIIVYDAFEILEELELAKVPRKK